MEGLVGSSCCWQLGSHTAAALAGVAGSVLGSCKGWQSATSTVSNFHMGYRVSIFVFYLFLLFFTHGNGMELWM